MKKKLVSVLAGLITLVAITAAPAHAGSTVNGNLNGYQIAMTLIHGQAVRASALSVLERV